MRRRTAWAGAASLCVLLAVLHTWPLATAPGTLSRNDNNDAQLNEWIMAWVAHQLPRAPTHLFDANIFFPARHTLAFSEPLIVPALLGAPVAWAGGSPVLVTNLMVMAGFALTAFAGFALVHRWTGDIPAGLLTGVDIGLQYAHADATRTRPGAASLRTPARLVRVRSPAHDTSNPRRAVAGAVDGRAGVHVRISRRVCRCHAGHRLAGTAARMGALLQEGRADACARGGAGGGGRGAVVAAVPSRGDRIRNGTVPQRRRGLLRVACGLSRRGRNDPLIDLERQLFPRSRGQFLSGRCRNRSHARSHCGRPCHHRRRPRSSRQCSRGGAS